MKYVAYYRTWAENREEAELELTEQKAMVQAAVNRVGGGELVGEHTDVEVSGKTNKRVNLKKALSQAKRFGAVVFVSKFDRISRDVNYIISLMADNITLVACDQLAGNKLAIHVFASLVDIEEGDTYTVKTDQSKTKGAQRTRFALRLIRATTSKVGSPQNLTVVAQQKGAQAVKQKAIENKANKRATVLALELRRQNKNLTEIAFQLNADGYTTAKGKQFQPVQVQRLLQRAEETHRVDKTQADLFDQEA
jgi:DNA invertase Pin-like site-specific DNA recombinase